MSILNQRSEDRGLRSELAMRNTETRDLRPKDRGQKIEN